MTYTTDELIQILDCELKENWKGKRIVLSSTERLNDPVMAKALNMDQVNKVFAYRDFRSQIHDYQNQTCRIYAWQNKMCRLHGLE